jgi:hypothetical protein
VLSALWALGELSIALRHVLTSRRRSLLHFGTPSPAPRVISRGAPRVCGYLRLPPAGLPHPLHQEFTHLPQVLLHPVEYPVHFLDALPEDHILGLAPLGDELHIVFHLRPQVGLVELDAQVLVGLHQGDPDWRW